MHLFEMPIDKNANTNTQMNERNIVSWKSEVMKCESSKIPFSIFAKVDFRELSTLYRKTVEEERTGKVKPQFVFNSNFSFKGIN